MTVAATQFPLIGVQPVSNSSIIGVEIATTLTGYVPLIPVGTQITVNDPYYGAMQLVRLVIPAGSAFIYPGTLSVLAPALSFVAVPNTGNTGFSVAASLNAIPVNAGFAQYAWFVTGGQFVFLSTASVAAAVAIGVAAVGKAGANSAGKQLLNARVVLPATGTVVKANSTTQSGTPFVKVNSSDGLFVGQAVSGTGIPATTSIGAIDAAGTTVSLVGSVTLLPVNATATGGTTLTFTNNDGVLFFNTVTFNGAFMQGAVT